MYIYSFTTDILVVRILKAYENTIKTVYRVLSHCYNFKQVFCCWVTGFTIKKKKKIEQHAVNQL